MEGRKEKEEEKRKKELKKKKGSKEQGESKRNETFDDIQDLLETSTESDDMFLVKKRKATEEEGLGQEIEGDERKVKERKEKDARKVVKDRRREKKREENAMKNSGSRAQEAKKGWNVNLMDKKAKAPQLWSGGTTVYEVSPVTYVDITCPAVVMKNHVRFLGFIGFNYAAGSSYGRENVDGLNGGTVLPSLCIVLKLIP